MAQHAAEREQRDQDRQQHGDPDQDQTADGEGDEGRSEREQDEPRMAVERPVRDLGDAHLTHQGASSNSVPQ